VGPCQYRPRRHARACSRDDCFSYRAGSFACQFGGQGRSRRQDTVKAMLKQDIVREATRLTRAGRLVEATVLLQRMLRGKNAPGPTFGTAGEIALTRREPPIIDAKANIIEETYRPHSRVTSAQPHVLRD